jgi:glyoxylase-like metal-dependent hydrolase (beta-lactamase superfamily II)
VEIVDDATGVVLRRVAVGPLDTNCWAVHAVGSREALVVDPGDEPARLLDAFADLHLVAAVLTHAHFDHVLALPDLVDALGLPVLAHPDDAPVWPHELDRLAATGHWDAGTATGELLAEGARLRPSAGDRLWNGRADGALREGRTLRAGPLEATVLHTPGHTPGGISLALPGHLLTGDTLFPGGPGLTGWPLSDFDTIIGSVRRLLTLPDATAVHPGHGPDTAVGHERPHLPDWIGRGW